MKKYLTPVVILPAVLFILLYLLYIYVWQGPFYYKSSESVTSSIIWVGIIAITLFAGVNVWLIKTNKLEKGALFLYSSITFIIVLLNSILGIWVVNQVQRLSDRQSLLHSEVIDIKDMLRNP